jgi:hypothetical protein
MKPKRFFLIIQFYLFLQIGCREILPGPKVFFSNHQTKLESIATLYQKLNTTMGFELYLIPKDTPAVQVFWDIEKSYKLYENSFTNAALISFIESNGIDKEDFFSLIKLMNEIKCKYVASSYSNGKSIYYILGFHNGISLKDLQYIFLSGETAENYFKDAPNVKQVKSNIYFRYAKAPGD